MIRVLIVDDSSTVRMLLRAILEADPELEVVGEAVDGVEGVQKADRLKPDLITMDVHMPRMDGLEATKQIMIRSPVPIVVVSASDARAVVTDSFDLLQAGAMTVLEKPVDPAAPEFDKLSRDLVATVKALASVPVVRRRAESEPVLQPVPESGAPWIVALAASTGGPGALSAILGAIPSPFPAPVLVVQHIAEGFADGLVGWLSGRCRIPLKLAVDGEKLASSTVYFAPHGTHLGVGPGGRVALSDAPPIDGHRPSATHMFGTVAALWRGPKLAVVLTGMGQDGLVGVREVKARGGRVIVQDRATSIVYGMNGEVEKEGLAEAVLPLEEIASRITEVIGGTA